MFAHAVWLAAAGNCLVYGSHHQSVAHCPQNLPERVKHHWNQGRGGATIGLLNDTLVFAIYRMRGPLKDC